MFSECLYEANRVFPSFPPLPRAEEDYFNFNEVLSKQAAEVLAKIRQAKQEKAIRKIILTSGIASNFLSFNFLSILSKHSLCSYSLFPSVLEEFEKVFTPSVLLSKNFLYHSVEENVEADNLGSILAARLLLKKGWDDQELSVEKMGFSPSKREFGIDWVDHVWLYPRKFKNTEQPLVCQILDLAEKEERAAKEYREDQIPFEAVINIYSAVNKFSQEFKNQKNPSSEEKLAFSWLCQTVKAETKKMQLSTFYKKEYFLHTLKAFCYPKVYPAAGLTSCKEHAADGLFFHRCCGRLGKKVVPDVGFQFSFW